MKKSVLSILYSLIILTMLSACATNQVAEIPRRFFWPPEPDVPKIEWIDVYYGDADIKKKTFMSNIVGEDEGLKFRRPISIAGNGEGQFVVADQELGQAFLFDLNKQIASPVGGDSAAASIVRPTGVAADAAGNFYISDKTARKVFVIDKENRVLRVMDFSEKAESIGGIAIDRIRATLVIPDAKGKKVLISSLNGDIRLTIDGKGDKDGKGFFTFPNAAATASDGSIYIADSYNARVLHFSIEGKYINTIGKRGDSAGDLTLATSVAVDSEDHIYVMDGRLHNMTIFDKEGNILLVVGGQHSVISGNVARGGFQIPQGISIDKNDLIYVADSFNRRVQLFQYLNERYLAQHPIVDTKR